ncbi:hypothetical protein [Bifidobacterium sp. wkB338]|uniref:hypothetical protein n=1 Tax=Bifidobacterium sp. wkB338 TaxID=2025114 RepID=UPI00217E867B|nr:hypothetical protein [Bifidobacterium sp. wkB338]
MALINASLDLHPGCSPSSPPGFAKIQRLKRNAPIVQAAEEVLGGNGLARNPVDPDCTMADRSIDIGQHPLPYDSIAPVEFTLHLQLHPVNLLVCADSVSKLKRFSNIISLFYPMTNISCKDVLAIMSQCAQTRRHQTANLAENPTSAAIRLL